MRAFARKGAQRRARARKGAQGRARARKGALLRAMFPPSVIITRFLYFEISILIWQVFVKNRDDFLAFKRYLKIRTSMYFSNFFEVQVHTSTCTYKGTNKK